MPCGAMRAPILVPVPAMTVRLEAIGLVLLSLFATACHNHADAAEPDPDAQVNADATLMLQQGRQTFRHDTFGSEGFYGGRLKLHQAIAGAARGGVGDGLSPRAALDLGLKVDEAALADDVRNALRNHAVNLDDPQVTLDLLAANAVVGLTGVFAQGHLTGVGIQCALCHSTVDDHLLAGIGRRLDGWANRDLDVGKIILLAPDLQPLMDTLQVDAATVRSVLGAWGPGRFDAQLLLDGRGFRPDGATAATLIPPAFGLAGVNQHTSTGSWGTISYWNAFVANIEMQGAGTFIDPRLDDPLKYPVAARNLFGNLRATDDKVSGKLGPLHFYQLALLPPAPPVGSFDTAAAERGRSLFAGQADCARCHVPPLFTEPGYNLHTPGEIGIDDFQASRAPDGRYRTAPLRGLWSHAQGGFYHDGRFATLLDVVEHYDAFFHLGLASEQKADLVEYLKSL